MAAQELKLRLPSNGSFNDARHSSTGGAGTGRVSVGLIATAADVAAQPQEGTSVLLEDNES